MSESDLHSPVAAERELPRSFVRRAGRITDAQRRAIDDLWLRYGVSSAYSVDPGTLFGRKAPICVEIGFGMGDSLASVARERPDWDHVGIEVHEPGIGRLLNLVSAAGLNNLRIMHGDAAHLLRDCFAADSLDQILVYFPDPWPKKRHRKRRLIQPALVQLLATRLRAGGRLELATDWQDYAEQMLQVLDDNDKLENSFGPGCFAPRPVSRPTTKFERRGHRLGHAVWDLIYVRNNREKVSST